jgi:hypothetical protein
MSVHLLKTALLWCLAFNYGLLLLWVVLLVAARDSFYRLNSRLFGVSRQVFDAANYGGIVGFKLLVIFFNLVPYVALALAT